MRGAESDLPQKVAQLMGAERSLELAKSFLEGKGVIQDKFPQVARPLQATKASAIES